MKHVITLLLPKYLPKYGGDILPPWSRFRRHCRELTGRFTTGLGPTLICFETSQNKCSWALGSRSDWLSNSWHSRQVFFSFFTVKYLQISIRKCKNVFNMYNIFPKTDRYHIYSYSCRSNYSFLKLVFLLCNENLNSFLTRLRKPFKGGNYSWKYGMYIVKSYLQ